MLETTVLSCVFAIKKCFSSKILAVIKTTFKYIAGLQDSFKDKYMNGKSNYKLNQFKSMQAATDSMFVNEKIIRIYSFCSFSP